MGVARRDRRTFCVNAPAGAYRPARAGSPSWAGQGVSAPVGVGWPAPVFDPARTEHDTVRAQLDELLGPALDPTTAAIAQQLCPAADIRAESAEAFAETRLPAASVDLMVGNVSVGEIALHDPVHQRRLPLARHPAVTGTYLPAHRHLPSRRPPAPPPGPSAAGHQPTRDPPSRSQQRPAGRGPLAGPGTAVVHRSTRRPTTGPAPRVH